MERRLFRRIPVQLSVAVKTEDNQHIQVNGVELSSDGLGIECNTRQRNMITPGGCFVRNGRPLFVFIELCLTDETQEFKVAARCHVAFSRRISSEKCKIGLRFAEIENGGQQQILRFIENSLEAV